MKQYFLDRLPQSRGARIMAGCLLAYFALFFWLACRKFDACTWDTNDIAQLDGVFYMTLRGKFFLLYWRNLSYFAFHAEPLLLMVVPVFYLVPSPKTLLFIQTLCITLAAIPVYLIARKVLEHEAGGILMALAFLLCPSLVGQNINQASTAAFPLPFLLFAFYFFHEQRMRPFIICLALACLGKESIALTALMFVPYALWKRRSWNWALAAAVIPLAALGLTLGMIRPYFSQGRMNHALEYYPGFGNSLGEFVTTILTRPDKVSAALFTSANGSYVALMLMAAGVVLPFLAVEAVFIVPEAVLNLLSSNTGMKVPVWLYNVYVGTFLVIAALYAIPKVNRFLRPHLGVANYGPVLAGCLLVLSASNWWQWFRPQEYNLPPQFAAQQQAFKMVPPDDTLLVGPGQLLGHVSHREILMPVHMHAEEIAKGRTERCFLANWVLFDMNYRIPQQGWFVPRELFMAYATNSNYEAVFSQDNVFIFHRRIPFPLAQMPHNMWDEATR